MAAPAPITTQRFVEFFGYFSRALIPNDICWVCLYNAASLNVMFGAIIGIERNFQGTTIHWAIDSATERIGIGSFKTLNSQDCVQPELFFVQAFEDIIHPMLETAVLNKTIENL